MNNENMNMVDEDFSSFLTFKEGNVTVDYASAILLYAYLNDRKDWYYIIKEKEIRDFEYRSYVEYSRALFAQLFGLIKEYLLANDKSSRVKIVNSLKFVCSNIDSFCRGNDLDVVMNNGKSIILGNNLSLITNGHLGDEMYWDVYTKIISPLEKNAKILQNQEEEYYKAYEEETKRDIESIVESLPEEVKDARTEVIDIVEEKRENVKEFYDRVHIASTYQELYSAISRRKAKEISAAHKKLMDQCVFVNECNASPFRGDLRPMFNFRDLTGLIEHIKYGHSQIQLELKGIDLINLGQKGSHLASVRGKALEYANTTIDYAKKMGLLSETFNVENICNINKEDNDKEELFAKAI